MTEKSHVRKTICTAAVICWMVVIFMFSAKPADESEQMSLSVGKIIGSLFASGYSEWTEQEKQEFAEKIDYPVRKAAHASEYAMLGILLMAMFGAHRQTGAKKLIISQAAGMLYAASDEFHQLFVPGRSGQVSDVMLDSMGVLGGILLFLLAGSWIKRKQKRNIGKN